MPPAAVDRAAFIAAHTALLPVPLLPSIRLHLADEATALWQLTEEAMGVVGLPPPFWAFAWAGGQALARFVADRPALVAGRQVLDLASGSGLVAVAAAQAGAAAVEACDIDPFALAAIAMNAAANGVGVRPRDRLAADADEGWDVVLAGDISYERDMATALTGWLEKLARRGALVLIGDPGRSYLARDRLIEVAAYDVPVDRSLEDAEIKRAAVWRFRDGAELAPATSERVGASI